jgi:hypothetical protein
MDKYDPISVLVYSHSVPVGYVIWCSPRKNNSQQCLTNALSMPMATSATSVRATLPPPVQPTSRIQSSPQKDFTQRYRVRRRVAFNEFRDYFVLPREDFSSCDPIQWWYARKAQFPNLCRLALDILSIPGTLFPLLFIGGSLMFLFRLYCRYRTHFLRRARHHFPPKGESKASDHQNLDDGQAAASSCAKCGEGDSY